MPTTSCRNAIGHITHSLVLSLGLSLSFGAVAEPFFFENFEDGTIDSRVTVTSVGEFNHAPGIAAMTNFGSSYAFGFGRSTCGASCFDAHVTGFTITLDSPTFISSLSFKEIELFGNWGSGGAIFVDGALFGTTHYDFGRLPYNDLVADTDFRTHTINIDRVVSTVELRVRDITNSSEIFVDDISVSSVPEPGTAAMLLAGALVLAFRKVRHQNSLGIQAGA